MPVRSTTRPEHHSPFLHRTRFYQQFPTFPGAQHSSEYCWVPSMRLPGPGGHSFTVGGSGHPVDLQLARSAPQPTVCGSRGLPAIRQGRGSTRLGRSTAGRAHLGGRGQRGLPLCDPGPAPREPAERRPGRRGPGRGEGGQGWPGTPAGRAQPGRQKGRAGVRQDPTALTRLRGARAPSPPPPHTKAPARRARPDKEAAPPAAARLSIRRAARRAGPGRPRRPARSAPRRPGGGSAPRRPGEATSPHQPLAVAPGE